MTHALKIAFFGSSLVSAYWNGAATYYRGIIRALHQRGHRVTFYEPDAFQPPTASRHSQSRLGRGGRLLPGDGTEVLATVEKARGADLSSSRRAAWECTMNCSRKPCLNFNPPKHWWCSGMWTRLPR